MDWEGLREKTLAQVGTSIATEGAGTAGGFVGAAFIGRQIQQLTGQTDANVAAKPGFQSAALAWAANNLPKAAIWYLTRSWAGGAGGGAIAEVKADARKALAGSIVFDTLIRFSNGGVNPASAQLFGWQVLGNGNEAAGSDASMKADVQRLIGENSALRAELNKAMQRNAGLQPYPPGQAERQRKYGFTEAEAALQKPRAPRYGFMEGADQKAESAASLHGML